MISYLIWNLPYSPFQPQLFKKLCCKINCFLWKVLMFQSESNQILIRNELFLPQGPSFCLGKWDEEFDGSLVDHRPKNPGNLSFLSLHSLPFLHCPLLHFTPFLLPSAKTKSVKGSQRIIFRAYGLKLRIFEDSRACKVYIMTIKYPQAELKTGR